MQGPRFVLGSGPFAFTQAGVSACYVPESQDPVCSKAPSLAQGVPGSVTVSPVELVVFLSPTLHCSTRAFAIPLFSLKYSCLRSFLGQLLFQTSV